MSLTEAAASVAARAFFYPSLAWNMARNKLQEDWHWWDSVTEGVILGAIPFLSQLEELKGLGVTAVVTLNEDFEVFITSDQYKEQGFTHLHIPTVDFLYAPPTENLHQGADFIHGNASEGGKTYVHCKAGRGRSTTLVLCYLIKYFGYDPEQAYAFVRQKRPQVYLAQGQWTAVCAFYISCHADEDLDAADFPYPKFLPLAPGKQGCDGLESSAVDQSPPSELDSSGAETASSSKEEIPLENGAPLGCKEGIPEELSSRSAQQDNDRRLGDLLESRAPQSSEACNDARCLEQTSSTLEGASHVDDEVRKTTERSAAGQTGEASCTTVALDVLTTAMGACSVQAEAQSVDMRNPAEVRAASPPARASSPAIQIPQPKISNPSDTPKCSISIEPSGSLPGYVRIAPQGKGIRHGLHSPISVCSMPEYSPLKEDSENHAMRSGFAEVCQEDEDWASVDSD